ncbi:c-type cytochrome [Sphingomonas sp.]|uniref:c-type cytochrome n=1 Tax=Sphingomonas sp. TaxID=28214 RepID=UPI001B183262|nr:c-type cytochrome [Sphingomonas sp.]MBO9711680.1 c-type cytochrome [Sphingomonas sp.]
MRLFHPIVAAVPLAAAVCAFASPPAEDGRRIFDGKCRMCHSIEPGAKGGIGPNLRGVGGRAAGSTAYAYSPALRKAGVRWDAASLDRFLAAPTRMVPGTRMAVAVPDPAQREAVVRYLLELN